MENKQASKEPKYALYECGDHMSLILAIVIIMLETQSGSSVMVEDVLWPEHPCGIKRGDILRYVSQVNLNPITITKSN